MNGLKLISTGRALPQTAVSNDDMRRYVETSDEWISTRTGIKERRICTKETITDLAVTAAKPPRRSPSTPPKKRLQPAV